MTQEERRKFPRVTMDAVTRLRKTKPPPPAPETDGVVKNLSLGGVFIETERKFSEGDWIEFVIHLDIQGKLRAVNARGKVVWCRREKPLGIGIAFTKVSAADKKNLGTVIWHRR